MSVGRLNNFNTKTKVLDLLALLLIYLLYY